MTLKNKVIAITGGAGGIGSLLSQQFSQRGAKVIVIDRVESIDFEAKFVTGDLSSTDGVKNIVHELKNDDIDILVNLAGLQYFGPMEQESMDHTALLYFVNLVAPVLLTQALLPKMKQKKSGQIVNIGSTFGSINFAHFVTYSSSKSGVKGFSEALRREVKSDGIDVTYIAPRAVKTPLNTSKVLEFAKMVNMNMDEPQWVVDQILKAIVNKQKETYLGFPEKLFVRINSLFPRLVDWSLFANDQKAKKLF
ncbi:SDR family oxidoreductase [Pseudoalteromonas denitrificans]|uniref:Short-chain dehydrogenase n=1 Tax=Pseudoalteromonas denitrificans DSM 6059 TaxID=1123010 RepID=A0A1I1KVP0_9GAMM|nr:SDR family oxidoreductase [Pseudoalteromonas denitrificans]SFC62193.1 Short-chain dehydrogenase [Pseudoalteromonas denitrificans DSM 6059]